MIFYSRIKYALPLHQKALFSTVNGSKPDYYQILGFCPKELGSEHFEKIPDNEIK